jgi:carboxyl-terminal processing protease
LSYGLAMSSTPGRLLRLIAALALAACAACGDDSANGEQVVGACTIAAENAAVLARANDWYLYQDLVPGSAQYQQLVSTPFDGTNYATTQDLVDAFAAAARAEHKDRYWSYLLTKAQTTQYFENGQSAGYGIGLLITGSTGSERLFITQVMRGSPAAKVGFTRGDEILALGSTEQGMVDIPTLVDGNTFGAAISGATVGTVKYFSVVPRGAAQPVTRMMTSEIYDLDPVVPSTIASPGGKKVGYVLLRTFVSTADDKLRAAFATFLQEGVTDVVVDVRYNGGGLLATAQVLGSLLHPTAGELMYKGQYNGRHTDQDWTKSFTAEGTRLRAVDRVAFITTSGTASASELVPNALGPYLGTNLAIVGDRTYGKPVGQQLFDTGSSCNDELFLISFQLQNKAGFGGYYDGLPDTAGQYGGTSCVADDDLTHEMGDAAEASTAQALAFIDGTPCNAIAPATATAAAGASRLSVERAAAIYPRAEEPSPAQLEMPGLF